MTQLCQIRYTAGITTRVNKVALTVGVHNLVISAQDSGIGGVYPLKAATANVAVTVLGLNLPPVWASGSISRPAAAEGAAYAATLVGAVSDPNAVTGDTVSFSKLSGPSWLVVSADGSLTGTPSNTDIGANVFNIRASDDYGLTADASLTIDVANVAPVAAGAAYSCPVDGAVNQVAIATDVGSTVLSYTVVRQPASGSTNIQTTHTPSRVYS